MSRRRRRRRFRSEQPAWAWLGLAAAAVFAFGSISVAAITSNSPPAASEYVSPAQAGEGLSFVDEEDPDVYAVFIGDSYSAGAGASEPAKRWTRLASDALGWIERNEALGGTGYLNTASRDGCGKDYCENYPEAITTSRSAPQIVVISGGRNDMNATIEEFSAAVSNTLTVARGRWPEAEIVVTSPLWDDDPAPEKLNTATAVVRDAAAQAGVRFLDLGQPLAGRADFVSSDSIHPSDAGYAAIAEAFVAAWGATTEGS